VACLLDANTLERTGPVGARVRAMRAKTMVVDHHQPDPAESWDVKFVDPSAPASGVLVYRLAARMGIELPAPALEAVFVSLTTDTGWFKYSNTDTETFRVASELVQRGVDPSAVYRKLFQTYSMDYPAGIGVALRSLRYEAGGKLAVASVRARELESHKAQLSETEDVLDLLRSVGSVEVVLLFRELAAGRAKCSARSKGEFDVHALMKRFGGGGHKKAAGADLEGPYDAAVSKVVTAAVAMLEKR
jgi:phosphoesterase RecJ-like protein